MMSLLSMLFLCELIDTVEPFIMHVRRNSICQCLVYRHNVEPSAKLPRRRCQVLDIRHLFHRARIANNQSQSRASSRIYRIGGRQRIYSATRSDVSCPIVEIVERCAAALHFRRVSSRIAMRIDAAWCSATAKLLNPISRPSLPKAC